MHGAMDTRLFLNICCGRMDGLSEEQTDKQKAMCPSTSKFWAYNGWTHIIIMDEVANLMALLYVMFPCDFVTFPYGVSGQVWYLIVSSPDLCLLPYFSVWSSLILVQTCIIYNQLFNRKLADERHFQLRF